MLFIAVDCWDKIAFKRECDLGKFNRGLVIFWYEPEMDLGDLNGP